MRRLNQNLLEEIDEVITGASNTNGPQDSKFVKMQHMYRCLKEEDVIFP